MADNFQQNQPQQVGYALLRMEDSDPVWSQAMSAEATRLWARFFSSGNPSYLHISIPIEWVNFFTIQLLTPENFPWIRKLLSSKVTPLLNQEQDNRFLHSIKMAK